MFTFQAWILRSKRSGHLASENRESEENSTQQTESFKLSLSHNSVSETSFTLSKARRQPCLLKKLQATKGRGSAQNHDLDLV